MWSTRIACPSRAFCPGNDYIRWTGLDAAGGDVVWSFRTSKSFNLEELLGALVVQTETLKRKLVRQWEDDDPDLE